MTARDKAFAALHAISGAKYLPIEALEKRLRHFGFAEQWVTDTAREWYREFGRGGSCAKSDKRGALDKQDSGDDTRQQGTTSDPLGAVRAAPAPSSMPPPRPAVIEEEGPMFAPPVVRPVGRCQCREAVGCCGKDAARLILVPLAEGRPGVNLPKAIAGERPRVVVAYCESCASHAEKGEPCGELPGSDVNSCFCGRAVPEAGDFCSQACRSQALEESR